MNSMIFTFQETWIWITYSCLQDVVSQRKEKILLLDILIQVLYVMDTSLNNATDWNL